MKKLKFDKDMNVTFLGRNGTFAQEGIEVLEFHNFVEIAPTTSKHETGRAWLQIPKKDLPKFIEILNTIANEA